MLGGGGAAGNHEGQGIATQAVHQQLSQLAVPVRNVHLGQVCPLHVGQG